MSDSAEQPAADSAQEEEDEDRQIPEDFKYSAESEELCRARADTELPPEFCALHCSLGFPSYHRYNINLLDDDTIIFIGGNSAQILNLKDNSKKIIFGHSTAGIGSIAVSPDRKYFAVAEKGDFPNIFIYEYPSFDICRILRKGTECAYSDVTFSNSGTKLASVGKFPDYMLTVWDWRQETVILRCKAFSQEVFHVDFSPVNEGRLITSGTGHIRFWKMASTFTGLKLQGDIGKFGALDLTDVSAYAELPGGKVISGTETGNLLMWDGEFVQFEMIRKNNDSCHDGMIEFLHLNGTVLTSAGADGFIRQWDIAGIEFVEVPENDPKYRLDPVKEFSIGDDASILHMLPRGEDGDCWLVQDKNGRIADVNIKEDTTKELLNFHAHGINAMAISPKGSHVAVTAGQDGSVRCWDVRHKKVIYAREFEDPVTSLCWPPLSVDDKNRTVLVGFSNGVVRVLERYIASFLMVVALKPHTAPVVSMAFSPDGKCLATASEDKTVFFFEVLLRPDRPKTNNSSRPPVIMRMLFSINYYLC
eukprot:91592_1